MKKSVQVISTILVLCVAFAALFTLVGCSGSDDYNWTVKGDDGDIRAYYSDNGKYGFILNIEGKGKLPDYAAYKDAPWYVKNGRIEAVGTHAELLEKCPDYAKQWALSEG